MRQPTENDVVRYEQRLAMRQARRQRGHPVARLITKYIIWSAVLAAVGYVLNQFLAAIYTVDGQNGVGLTRHDCLSGWPLSGTAIYVGLIVLWWLGFHSHGHKVRGIARARRAAVVPAGPFQGYYRYCVLHPYWSSCLRILLLGQAMTFLSNQTRRR